MQQTSRHLQKSTEAEGETSAYTPISTTESEKATPSQESGHAPSEPAFFEITPDIIDQLAAGAAKETSKRAEQAPKREYTERTFERRPDRRTTPDKAARKPFNRDERSLNSTYEDDSFAPRRNFRSKHTEEPAEASTRSPKKPFKKEEDDWVPPPRLPWQSQKAALKEKFSEGWAPRKRLSPDALAGIRAINAQFPAQYTVPVLAAKFEVSPEAIRRILKSNWRPDEEEEEDRKRRWYKRGQQVWTRYAELGLKPPRRWRDEGIGKREKGWKTKEKEERDRERDVTSTTWNPRLTRKPEGDGFV
ncbi:hypothetical protein V495_06520 [Pseudogymnoascus sp. VKM F-4514 (FW-929)]|nr:hypothetical protein V495_06520 [Pseudogymnoascus sp. VKM F-4514 (FW-929)]KFY51762.1 hypothetical protein V497_08872 [Pseudogymnoascus sp. VKM F-4516 (FW-969)]